jgi:hypothetical protein
MIYNINGLLQRQIIYTPINHLYFCAHLPTPPSSDDAVTADDVRVLATAMGCRTQAELAKRLGVTQARVSQILSGAYPVKPGALMQLIRALQTTYQGHTSGERFSAASKQPRQRRTRR